MSLAWKKGRGKLGIMQPLLGRWSASGDSERGPYRCTRSLEKILSDSFIRMSVRWHFGNGPDAPCSYEELAIFGIGNDGGITFWSYTSDGKKSSGHLVEAPDVHEKAIAFEAQMPAGLARMSFWPDGADGYFWAVESKNKKGWNRFMEQHYKPE